MSSDTTSVPDLKINTTELH